MGDRVNWDDSGMVKAFWAARRSPDPSTRHGCYISDARHRPISDGYNGYPRNCDHAKMPKTRPAKYLVTLHAEENAILNAQRSLEGATLYVTGPPCSRCWTKIIQTGIARVVIGPKRCVKYIDEADAAATRLLLEDQNLEIVEWSPVTAHLQKAIGELLHELGLDGARPHANSAV